MMNLGYIQDQYIVARISSRVVGTIRSDTKVNVGPLHSYPQLKL